MFVVGNATNYKDINSFDVSIGDFKQTNHMAAFERWMEIHGKGKDRGRRGRIGKLTKPPPGL